MYLPRELPKWLKTPVCWQSLSLMFDDEIRLNISAWRNICFLYLLLLLFHLPHCSTKSQKSLWLLGEKKEIGSYGNECEKRFSLVVPRLNPKRKKKGNYWLRISLCTSKNFNRVEMDGELVVAVVVTAATITILREKEIIFSFFSCFLGGAFQQEDALSSW